MFRKIDNHKLTAHVGRDLRVRVMYDDGWEDILSHHFDVASEQEGITRLIEMGYEEYDPNAHLKAQGMVFINGCYRMPEPETHHRDGGTIPGVGIPGYLR